MITRKRSTALGNMKKEITLKSTSSTVLIYRFLTELSAIKSTALDSVGTITFRAGLMAVYKRPISSK